MSTFASTTSRPMASHGARFSPPAAIRSFLMLLWLEIRRSQGYWLLPVMVGLGIYAPSIGHLPGIVLWPEMSLATLQSYVIVAPLAAALAAWLVDRDRRRRTRNLVESVPRSGFPRDMLALACAAFWGLLGYLGVALWFCGQAVFKATWGKPDTGLMFTGALAVIAFAALGVLVGRLAPSKYSPLLAFGLTFFLTIGADLFKVFAGEGGYRNPLQLLMPYGLYRSNDPSVFYRAKQDFVTEVSLWMLALIAVLVAMIAISRARQIIPLAALAGTLTLAGVAATPLVGPDNGWGMASPVPIAFTPVCEEIGGFETCIHPAYEAVLHETAVQVSTVFGPVQGLEGVPTRWQQAGPFMAQQPAGVGMIDSVGYQYGLLESIAYVFPPPNDDQSEQRPASQLVIMEWLVQEGDMEMPGGGWFGRFGWPSEVEVKIQDYGNGISGRGSDQAELDAFQPQMDAALARFSALTPQQQRAWLEENWDALRTGELTLDDLP